METSGNGRRWSKDGLTRREVMKIGGLTALGTMAGGMGLTLLDRMPAAAAPARRGTGRVHFYSPETPAMTRQMGEAFTRATGTPVDVTYGGTAVIFNRILAEKDNPNGDLWYGAGGMIPFEVGRARGLITPYTPPEWRRQVVHQHGLKMRDENWHWIAAEVFVIGIAYNTELVPKDQLPKTWEDLLHPRWRGEIQIPNPATSGTATLFVMSRLSEHGLDRGWKYLGDLVKQTNAIPDSGAGPTRAVAKGEAKLALCFDFMPYQLAVRGEKTGFILPPQTPIIANPVALLNNGPNPDLGKRFIDWLLSADGGQAIIGEWSQLPIHPMVPRDRIKRPTLLPDVLPAAQKLKIDWLVENWDNIRGEWRKRFG